MRTIMRVILGIWLAAAGSGMAVAQTRPPALDGVMTFQLRLNRLLPEQVTVKPGRYFVRVANSVVLGDVIVEIDGPSNTRIISTRVSRRVGRFSRVLNLKSGTYTVRVLGKPTWVSTITVADSADK